MNHKMSNMTKKNVTKTELLKLILYFLVFVWDKFLKERIHFYNKYQKKT